MILTFVNEGKSGPEGINYLFSEKDANGNLRDPPAELLEGDILLTKYLIQNNPRTKKYSSYSLNFRDNEKVTDMQLKEMVQAIRDTFCMGRGPDEVSILAVKHTDKSNIELHLIIIDEINGKQFNPFPPGDFSKKLQQDFCAYWNHKLGFEQVVGNPFKASFSRFDAKAPTYRKEEYSKNLDNNEVAASKERKEKLSAIVTKAVMDGKINNRKDLIDFLTKKGCTITRKGKDYLSIKLPGKEKAIRFKGGAFVENVDYSVLIAEHNTASKHLTSYKFKEVEKRLNAAMDYKKGVYERIYAPKKNRVPKHHESKAVNNPDVKPKNKNGMNSHSNNIVEAKPKENAQVSSKNSSKPIVKNNKQAPQNSVPSVSSRGSNESALVSIGSLENKIYSLGVRLSQVPIEQRAQIQAQIAALKIQLERMQHQWAEAKKAELNKGGPSKPKFK